MEFNKRTNAVVLLVCVFLQYIFNYRRNRTVINNGTYKEMISYQSNEKKAKHS